MFFVILLSAYILPATVGKVRILQIRFHRNGSIREAAKRLIIHPNTLQYQLKRIEEKTGYDPRKLRDSGIFSIAAQFLSEPMDLLDSEL